MKFLVTGGLGFIGSNFIIHVLKKYSNIKIINLDACLSGSNPKNLREIKHHKNYEFVKGNINNSVIVDRLVSRSDVVFNFAAESHVDRSILDSKPFIYSNIVGVHTILEAIRKHRKKMIHISTDEVFGSLSKGSAHEKYPFNPSSPYAASKASAEMLVQSYFTTYDCNVIITRCTNNYGPRQSPEKLIPKVILLAEKNKKIPIYGTGKNIRDWIFVRDHCEAILKIFQKGRFGESYNISASNEIDNIVIIKKILSIMDKPSHLIHFTRDRPGHDFRYSLNSSKIRRELGWKPTVRFEDGLEQTIKWYLNTKEWRSKISSKDMLKVSWKHR